MPELSDEAIAGKVQTGDTEAFGLIIERYEEKLLRYGRRFHSDREDIRDLVQEVFIKAYMNIQSFDLERRFSPWIYRIAHNEFVNAVKKRIRNPLSYFDFDTMLPHAGEGETVEDEMGRQEMKQMIEAHLKQLDEKYREPLILYYFEDMDYKEIADILQIPISTVGVRLQRGKMALKKLIKKKQLYE